ncbi:hypothetical protein CHUAL_009976 [Chamberlinius hualienensis]
MNKGEINNKEEEENSSANGNILGKVGVVNSALTPSAVELTPPNNEPSEKNSVEPGKKAGSSFTMDQLLDELGSPGISQILVYILLCMNVFPVSLNFMAMSFFGATPKQTCKLPDGWFMNTSIPKKNNDTFESCLMYKNPENHTWGTEKCIHGYDYQIIEGRVPIAVEWDLVCDNVFLVRLAQTIFFAGVMIGGLLFGYFADRIGRKPIILFTLYCQAIFGVIVAFSANYIMFVVLKFFQGMMLQGLQTSNNTAVMELYQTRFRTRAGMGVAMLATACSMIIGLISYLVPHWKYMQLTISVPSVITILFLWFLPESLRWLLSAKKLDEANIVALKYANYNKLQSPTNLEQKLEQLSDQIVSNTKQTVHGNIKDLITIPKVRRTSIILFYLWFTASVVYYGITLSIPNLNGNPSLNFFIVGALETTSRFAGYFIINKFGRRIPMSICYVLSGIVCIVAGSLTSSLPVNTNEAVKTISTLLVLVGRAAMGQCFAIIGIVTSEVFPTVLRTVGSGACSVWTRIGGMLAPQALLIDDYVGKATPFILFGVLAIIGGGLTLLLPETLNVPLPDTVKDVKNLNDANTVEGQTNTASDDQQEVNPNDNKQAEDKNN